MTFNLKSFINKTAGINDSTIEGQLKRKTKSPDELQESQLKQKRDKTPESVFEKQLEAVRSDNTIFYTTEGQLGDRCKPTNQTTEAQLGSKRCECPTKLTEKTLDKNRQSSFNLKSYMERTAKAKVSTVTEEQLDNNNEAPNGTTDVQLKDSRSVYDGVGPLTEQRLGKSRTGEPNKLIEGLLDSSKSKLVQHRNNKTAQGDINKLDEQRKKDAKLEDYKPASETDKAMMLPEVKGEDGLRTASKHFKMKKIASEIGENQFGYGLGQEAMAILAQYHIGPHDLFRYDTPNSAFPEVFEGIQKAKQGDLDSLKMALQSRFGKPSLARRMMGGSSKKSNSKTAQYSYPVEPGIRDRPAHGWYEDEEDEEQDFEDLSMDLDNIENDVQFDEEKEYGDLINELTSDIEVPDEDEVNSLGITDESQPQYGVEPEDDFEDYEEEEEEENFQESPKDFAVESVQDMNVGTTELKQVVLSFDAYGSVDKNDIKQRAISFLYSEYPKLFSAKINGKPIELSQNINVNMNEGRITTTLPKSVF